MKKAAKYIIGIVTLVSLVIVSFLLFYRFQFHGSLSTEHSVWSDFGTIFNGILSPIFAAINICIFWYLTRIVDDNNNHRQEHAAAHEKAMILMQFRKAEIDRFDDIISNALVLQKDNDLSKLIRPVVLAMAFIQSFLNTKLELFNLDENSETAQNLNALHSDLSEYFKKLSTKKDIPKEFLKDTPLTMENFITLQNRITDYLNSHDENAISKDLFADMINRKNSIVSSLQQITINS